MLALLYRDLLDVFRIVPLPFVITVFSFCHTNTL